jgi:hypothetical protein
VFNSAGNEIKSDQIMNNSCVILAKHQLPESVFKIS